jgi:hypothetical protein
MKLIERTSSDWKILAWTDTHRSDCGTFDFKFSEPTLAYADRRQQSGRICLLISGYGDRNSAWAPKALLRSLMSRGMSNRHLALAAAIVWAIAVLVGVFIAAPLWFGFDVNIGLIISGLAATGSFTAAAVAVWVATGDRRERRHEREAADKAQAALVIVEPVLTGNPGVVGAFVHNCGTLPILNVKLVGLEVVGQPHLDVTRGREHVRAVLEPRRDDKRCGVFECRPSDDPTDAYQTALYGDSDFRQNRLRFPHGAPSIKADTTLRATVWFEDAKGNSWETVFESVAGNVRVPQINGISATPYRISLARR